MITRVRIDRMMSQRCVQAVWTALTPVPGIAHAEVGIGAAVIEHDGSASAESIREAIAVAGYEVVEVIEERRTLRVL